MKRREAYRIFERVFERLKAATISDDDPTPRYRFHVHHLTIMSNHYHLVISASEATPIDRVMQQINAMVARAFNRLLGRRGHFWEDRFKSKILNSIDYLKRTLAYVYHNPIKAGLSPSARAYARSTFQFYWRGSLPTWLCPDPLLAPMPRNLWRIILKELVEDRYDPAFLIQ